MPGNNLSSWLGWFERLGLAARLPDQPGGTCVRTGERNGHLSRAHGDAADAVFEATLEDVSKADAKAEVIGQARIEQPGNPPIRFEITYDPSTHFPATVTPSGLGSWSAASCLHYRSALRGAYRWEGQRSDVAVAPRGLRGRFGVGAGSFGDLACDLCRRSALCRLPGHSPSAGAVSDQAFFLRMTYLGKGDEAVFDDIGSWIIASDSRTLVLHGAGRRR